MVTVLLKFQIRDDHFKRIEKMDMHPEDEMVMISDLALMTELQGTFLVSKKNEGALDTTLRALS